MDNRSLAHSGSPPREASDHHEARECPACYRGVVYIGYMVEDCEAGEEVEVIEPIPCRRCNDV